jgi:phage gpG-like protein
MISMRSRSEFYSQRVRDAARKGSFKSLNHAGAAIRLTARRSIKRGKRPSRVGQPPHTKKGQLKRSLRYAVEKQNERVLIGPTHTVVGRSGMAHEFGGKYKKQRYPTRPFMGPALKKVEKRLPQLWAGSVR